MNRVSITIDTGNEAFGDTECTAAMEVARILRELASRIEKDGTLQTKVLRDINGNQVGLFGEH